MFEKFITWLAQEQIRKAVSQVIARFSYEKVKDIESRDKIIEFEIDNAQGKKIIYCSNEWEDPTFAIVTGSTTVTKALQPMLVAKNVLTDEEVYIHPGTYYMADELLTMTIIGLNPFQRWNLTTGKTRSNMWFKGYMPTTPLTESWILEDKLRSCGFLFKHNEAYSWLMRNHPHHANQYDFELTGLDFDLFAVVVTQKSSDYESSYPLIFANENERQEFCNIVGKEIT